MNDDRGENESRTLANGEIVHLVKSPGEKWKIRLYEYRHNAVLGVGGLVFEYLESLPSAWKNQEFESADAAEAFVQDQIEQKTIPRNCK